MTSGTIGTTAWSTSSSPTSYLFYKNWVGSDGKYEVFQNSGRIKWNPYSADVRSRLISKSNWTGIRTNNTTFNVASVTIPASPDTSFTTWPLSAAENNRLLDKLIGKVNGHQFNLAVNLAQMNQVSSMASKALGELGRAFLFTRRGLKGDFLRAFRALGRRPKPGHVLWKARDVTGRWLEIQYGWLPTLSDVYEAAKAFETISSGPRTTLFKVGFRKPISQSFGAFTNGISGRLSGVRGRRIQFELYEEMSFGRQLGLVDPLSVIWELIPYSFVVDWFLPIGAYLSSLSQLPGLKGRWLVTDYVRYPRQRISWTDHPDSSFGGGYKSGTSYPDVIYNASRVLRTTVAPTLQIPIPKFEDAISPTRFLNAVALAYQRFGIR